MTVLTRSTPEAYEDMKARLGAPQVSFTLPVFPVPLSSCFVNVRRNGRADSHRYKAFKATVDTYLASYYPYVRGNPLAGPKCTTRVSVEYTLERPDRRQRDLDNLLKALNDTLTRNHILGDDSQIVDLRIRWKEPWVISEPVHVVIQEAA